MRLRRWRVVASVRVFPLSWRRRSLPAAAVFLFVSCTCGAVPGSGSFRAFRSRRVRRFVCGVARSVSLFCAERAGAPAGRTVPGSGSVRRRWGSSRSRGWGGATAGASGGLRRLFGSLRARGELFPWRGGVPLRWVAAFPAQRGLSVGSGPARPGARLPSACTTVVGGHLHRRCEFHCCRRHIAPEGHFRVAAHIITDRAPPHVRVTPPRRHHTVAHTTRRTIRAPRTHHQ